MNKKKDEPIWCKMYREKVIKPAIKQRQTEQRGRTEASRAGFYQTTAWKLLRDKRINENPLCQECEKKGRINAAKLVDHIKPVEDYPQLALSYENTQSLCEFCHNVKTRRDKQERKQRQKLERGKRLMKDLETPGG